MSAAGSLDGEFSLYRQVEAILRDQIADGQLRAGDRLPPEEALRAQFGVSRGTLRQALEGLERDGLVERSQGRGTYVGASRRDHTDRRRLTMSAAVALARSAVDLERQGEAVPPPSVAAVLGLPAGAEVGFFIKLASEASELHIGIKRYLAPALGRQRADLALEPDFDARLARLGAVAPGWSSVEAILAEPRFAMLLKVPLGCALLSVWWVDLLNDSPAVCTQMILPGSSFALDLKP
jgi:GntR family transcriptional regulator